MHGCMHADRCALRGKLAEVQGANVGECSLQPRLRSSALACVSLAQLMLISASQGTRP